ncbi:uncharacterized protein LOC144107307 [Amblyomma americanum]
MIDEMGCNMVRFMSNRVTDMSSSPDTRRPNQDDFCGTNDANPAVCQQGGTSRTSSPIATRSTHMVITLAGNAPKKLLAGFVRRPPSATPLRVHRERSLSQIEFFRVLEEKINRGKDFHSNDGISRCSTVSA